MRQAVNLKSRCAFVWLTVMSAVLASLGATTASGQLAFVQCPNWNTHYSSPTLAAKVYYESTGFVNSVGASCVPVKNIQCTASVPHESEQACTALLKSAIGCHQNPVPISVGGSG